MPSAYYNEFNKEAAAWLRELIAEMRELSERMIDLAVKLDYFGGFDGEAAQHAAELVGASGLMFTWADVMEAEQ